MKTVAWIAVLGMGLAAPLLADDSGAMAPAGSSNTLNSEQARVSYAIGMMVGAGWKQNGVEVDDQVFLQGLKDIQSGGTTLLTQQEMREVLTGYQKSLRAKMEQKREQLGTKNKTEGEAFLAANKSKPGIEVLPNGVQYKVIASGTGEMPKPNDIVTVNYRGTFIDGTEFDSSAKSGHPAQFQVSGVIPGWTEALQHMNTGSKWQLFIPSDLAYGPQGRGSIPPNAVLIFDVELLSVQKGQAPQVSTTPAQPLTSPIIKVPSAEEMKKGAKIEVIKPEEVQKMQGTNAGK